MQYIRKFCFITATVSFILYLLALITFHAKYLADKHFDSDKMEFDDETDPSKLMREKKYNNLNRFELFKFNDKICDGWKDENTQWLNQVKKIREVTHRNCHNATYHFSFNRQLLEPSVTMQVLTIFCNIKHFQDLKCCFFIST